MEERKLWETKLSEEYYFFKSTEEYFKYLIDNNCGMSFTLKDKFSFGDQPKDMLDTQAVKQNISITYTDNEHPIAVPKSSGFLKTYISPIFFKEHKEEFINFFKKYIDNLNNDNSSSITILDFAITDEELIKLINNPNLQDSYFNYRIIEEKKLTEEQIKLIRDLHLEFNIIEDNEVTKISTKKAINYYTYKELKNMESITLYIPGDIKSEEIDNFIYINGLENNANIRLPIKFGEKNEKEYFSELVNIFNRLASHNKKYNIEIEVTNRQKLKESGLLSQLPSNINVLIKNDLYTYNYETFMSEEETIEKLIAPIKQANLSPLEKYLAAYNIAKQFKPYKENKEDKNQSRYLRYILNNDYIVCVGFAKLLEEFLNHLEIPIMNIGVAVDVSYDKGFTQEEKTLNLAGHARCMVKIDDDKYNIHGIYVVDPTWDNDLENDLYLNALMTFDRKKEARRLEGLSSEDLLLDFHNIEEFKKKTAYYMKKQIKTNQGKNTDTKSYDSAVEKSYRNYYDAVLNILSQLDYQKYEYFKNKYIILKSHITNSLSESISSKDLDKVFNEMLLEYAEYILTLSNKKVSISSILKAATEVKRKVDGLTDIELKEWLENTIKVNKHDERRAFPYQYNPSNSTEAYLEDKVFEEDDEEKTKSK